MARFERQETTDDRLADAVGAATEQLRVALEREAVELITKAREEAADITDAAHREAARIEQEARRRAAETEQAELKRAEEASARADAANARTEELTAKADQERARADEESARAEAARASHADRISHALRDIDAMEERLLEAVGALRGRLSGEPDEIRPPALQPEPQAEPRVEPQPEPQELQAEPQAEPQVQTVDEAPAEPNADHAPTFSGPVPLSVATAVDSATERNPVLDDMMRAQIRNMAESAPARRGRAVPGAIQAGRGLPRHARRNLFGARRTRRRGVARQAPAVQATRHSTPREQPLASAVLLLLPGALTVYLSFNAGGFFPIRPRSWHCCWRRCWA